MAEDPEALHDRAGPPAALVAASLALCLVVAPTAQGFFANRLEFDLELSEFGLGLAALGGLAFLSALLVVRVLPRRARGLVTLAAVTLCLATLLEGNFLSFAYGSLVGGPLQATHPVGSRVGNTVAWLALLGLVSALRRPLLHHAASLLVAVSALHLVYLGLTLASPAAAASGAAAAADSPPLQLSRRANLVLLILDATQSDAFGAQLADGRIPAAAFDGFTYLRNATSGYSITQPSVPNLLTGTWYLNEEPFRDYAARLGQEPGYLGNLAQRAGYAAQVFSSARALPGLVRSFHPNGVLRELARTVEFGLFRQAPRLLKDRLYGDGAWPLTAALGTSYSYGLIDNLAFAAAIPSLEAGAQTPQLRVFHLTGSHRPYVHDEQLQPADLSEDPRGYDRVVTGVGALVVRLLDRLRAQGLYDQTALILLADHGYGRDGWLSAADRARYPAGVPLVTNGRGVPLLLVKPFAAHGPLVQSDAPVELADVPATVAGLLGLAAPAGRRSVLEHRDDEVRTRLHYQLADIARDVVTDRLAPMIEWSVDGFSWLEGSWHRTGAERGTRAELLESFTRLQPHPEHLGHPRLFGDPGLPLFQLTNDHHLVLSYPRTDVVEGDTIGLTIPIVGRAPGRAYEVTLELEDSYRKVVPGYLFQRVFVAGALVSEYDVGGAEDLPRRTVRARLEPDAKVPEVRFEVLSRTGEPWHWGQVAHRVVGIDVREAR